MLNMTDSCDAEVANTYKPRKVRAFDPAVMFDDGGKGKALDIRDYVHSGKISKALKALAFKMTGKPYLDYADLASITEEITRKYRATRIVREGNVNDVVEQPILLDRVNYRGNRIELVVTTERGSDLSFCNRTLISLWVKEKWANKKDESMVKVHGGVVLAIKKFFGLAA